MMAATKNGTSPTAAAIPIGGTKTPTSSPITPAALRIPNVVNHEVAVAPTHRERGIGRRLREALFERGRALGCREAWVGTEPSNTPARRLYAAAGGIEAPEPFVMVEFRLIPES
jgi:GNAT superfamily N-acetyltransferase